jgi:hypothetical protein
VLCPPIQTWLSMFEAVHSFSFGFSLATRQACVRVVVIKRLLRCSPQADCTSTVYF